MTSQEPTAVDSVEGKAHLRIPSLSNVFYNPRMSISRDIAILFVRAHFSKHPLVHLCDPMTGSGVRAARYLLEAENVAGVVAADRDLCAAELARQTAKENGLDARMEVFHADAHSLLSGYVLNRFDLVDLDPFGSPAPYFESALRATAADGAVAATATDMGPLAGARPAACVRKYGVWPVRTEFEKELAVRALVSHIVTTAAQMELGIRILFSHATDHYARMYATVNKGRKEANHSVANLGYLSYCPNCLRRSEAMTLSSVETTCAECHGPTKVGGPFWLGALWSRQTVESMMCDAPTLTQSGLSEVQELLDRAHGELDLPKFYYTTGRISSAYRTKPPTLTQLIRELRDLGYQASRTHFNPTGFRTDAPISTIQLVFRKIAEKT